jgi:hypothetical protein
MSGGSGGARLAAIEDQAAQPRGYTQDYIDRNTLLGSRHGVLIKVEPTTLRQPPPGVTVQQALQRYQDTHGLDTGARFQDILRREYIILGFGGDDDNAAALFKEMCQSCDVLMVGTSGDGDRSLVARRVNYRSIDAAAFQLSNFGAVRVGRRYGSKNDAFVELILAWGAAQREIRTSAVLLAPSAEASHAEVMGSLQGLSEAEFLGRVVEAREAKRQKRETPQEAYIAHHHAMLLKQHRAIESAASSSSSGTRQSGRIDISDPEIVEARHLRIRERKGWIFILDAAGLLTRAERTIYDYARSLHITHTLHLYGASGSCKSAAAISIAATICPLYGSTTIHYSNSLDTLSRSRKV